MVLHSSDSQTGMILEHLVSGKEINPMEALNKYGCYRLGAVIFNLKKEGYHISTRIHRFKKPSGRDGHYAVYKLEEKINV
jgi:hypothetical protein